MEVLLVDTMNRSTEETLIPKHEKKKVLLLLTILIMNSMIVGVICYLFVKLVELCKELAFLAQIPWYFHFIPNKTFKLDICSFLARLFLHMVHFIDR